MTDDAVFDARCGAIEATWWAWDRTLRALPDEAWAQPTRLDAWDVAALVAHHAAFPGALPRLVERAVDGPPTVASAAALLRFFNAPGGVATELAGAVADQAVQVAAATPRALLATRFADDGPPAMAAVRAAGPIVVDYFGNGTIALVEALAVLLMESAVHLLDLQRALGVAVDVPDDALRESVHLLADVADPIVLVEAATGRSAVSPFPVIR